MYKRRHERYDVCASIKFEWELADSTRGEGTGLTRDFSVKGLFVMTDDLPPVGSTVHCEVDLATSGSDSGAIVRAKGCVKRIEATPFVGRFPGFAVSSHRMKLEKL